MSAIAAVKKTPKPRIALSGQLTPGQKICRKLKSIANRFDELSDDQFIRIATVEDLFGVSRPTIYRWLNDGLLPKPIKIGTKAIAWRVGDIRKYIAKRESQAA